MSRPNTRSASFNAAECPRAVSADAPSARRRRALSRLQPGLLVAIGFVLPLLSGTLLPGRPHGTATALATVAAPLQGGRSSGSRSSTVWGRQLFASKHCLYCHRVGARGGRLGPALDSARRRSRSAAFLRAHFRNPAAATPGSVMPVIPLTEREVESLVLYVMSLSPGAPEPAILLANGSRATVPSVSEGKVLYQTASCVSCHAIGGKGIHVGPDLDNFGRSGRKLPWLLTHFRRPDDVAPGTPMPIVRGSDRQLRSLALYLLSLKTEVPPTAALGQRIYVQRACDHCHGDQGRGGKVGPRLAGTRRSGRTDAWLLDHIRDPASVVPGSAMPRVWAADWEQQSLLEYVRTLWLQDPTPGRRDGEPS